MWQEGKGKKKKKRIFKPESVGTTGMKVAKEEEKKKKYRNLIANSSLVRRNGRVSVSGSTFFL